jgi:hypothetical protein
MKEIFNEIPFGAAPTYKVSVDSRLRMSLDRALELYRESREKTLKQLYQQTQAMKMKTPEAEADLEEVSASCGHFSFSLLEFGEQLHELLAILDELQLESEERPNGRSWSWLKFWKYKGEHVVRRGLPYPHPEFVQTILTTPQKLPLWPRYAQRIVMLPTLRLVYDPVLREASRNDLAIVSGSPSSFSAAMIPSTRSRLERVLRFMPCRLSSLPPVHSTHTGEANGDYSRTCLFAQ